jgi:hypothetical protein
MGVADMSQSDSAARWIRRLKVINGSGIPDIFRCVTQSSGMDICLGLASIVVVLLPSI